MLSLMRAYKGMVDKGRVNESKGLQPDEINFKTLLSHAFFENDRSNKPKGKMLAGQVQPIDLPRHTGNTDFAQNTPVSQSLGNVNINKDAKRNFTSDDWFSFGSTFNPKDFF
jgi:hypothetical protein